MNVKLIFALAALVGLAGCESIGDATNTVRERIATRDEGKVRSYAAAPRTAYEAVRTAAADMGYRFLRGGPAQGEFEAVSSVRAGETHGSSRQISMKVKLKPTLDGKGTEIAVRLVSCNVFYIVLSPARPESLLGHGQPIQSHVDAKGTRATHRADPQRQVPGGEVRSRAGATPVRRRKVW